MDKSFSALQKGDPFYVWAYDRLNKYSVKEVIVNKPMFVTTSDGVNHKVINSDSITVKLNENGEFDIMCPSVSAMIWGTDGWHEYTIVGTSKESVKNCLKEALEKDMRELDDKTSKWLSVFEKEDLKEQTMEKMYQVFEVDVYFGTYGMSYDLIGAIDIDDLINHLPKIYSDQLDKNELNELSNMSNNRITPIAGVYTNNPYFVLTSYGYME